MDKHTPGPWEFQGMDSPGYISVSAVGETWAIATLFTDPISETMEANAKLIASAPAMLAKLREHLVVLSVIDPENPIIAETEKLIEKITE